MGRLTTHVLDTASGRPAAGMDVRLQRAGETVWAGRTNPDGRTGGALLEGDALVAGEYELEFDVGGYFAAGAATAGELPDPPFLGVVPVRFAIADPGGHYHVPLLVSPWAYSTYRGS
jgi:5-hydroxyisourate hydrolase